MAAAAGGANGSLGVEFVPKVMAQDSRIYAQAWDEIHYAKSLDKVVEALTRARGRLEHQPNLSVWLDSHAIDQLERFPHVNFSCPSKRRREDDLSWTTRCADALIEHVRPQQERLFNSATNLRQLTAKEKRVLGRLHQDLIRASEEGRAYGYDSDVIPDYLDYPNEDVAKVLSDLYSDVAWHQGNADPVDDADVDEFLEENLAQGMDEESALKEAVRESEKLMRGRFDAARRMIQDAQNEISPPKGLPRTRGARMRGLNALKRKLTSLP